MLILTRRTGQAVDLIDKATGKAVATVTVLDITGDHQIRLGFDAPPHISILRDNAIRRDNASQQDDTVGNR